MANVIINDTNLTNIANAIREKNGLTDTYKPSEMAAAITNLPSGGSVEVEPIVLTGKSPYAFSGEIGGNYITLFGDTITTSEITDASYMFYKCSAEEIPFDVNLQSNDSSTLMDYMFNYYSGKTLPTMNYVRPKSMAYLFSNCVNLEEIPDEFAADWNWTNLHTAQSSTSIGFQSAFSNCYKLKKVPSNILSNLWSLHTSSNYCAYSATFNNCVSLREVVGWGVSTRALSSTNYFSYTNYNNCMLSRFTFETNEDGTAKTAPWVKVCLNLQNGVGTASLIGRNSFINDTGMPESGYRVTSADDYATISAEHPDDWWTVDDAFSRYNHDSAVETLNSLPDCSASATSCTINFAGTYGSGYGKAISNLTEEEIAVATAKGWTVTLV